MYPFLTIYLSSTQYSSGLVLNDTKDSRHRPMLHRTWVSIPHVRLCVTPKSEDKNEAFEIVLVKSSRLVWYSYGLWTIEFTDRFCSVENWSKVFFLIELKLEIKTINFIILPINQAIIINSIDLSYKTSQKLIISLFGQE